MTDTFFETPRVGRSEYERYGVCPAQGALVESGVVQIVETDIMAAANGIHHAVLSCGVGDFAAGAGFEPEKVADELRKTRPDVQPLALAGATMRFLYAFRDWIYQTNPHNILRYDGGEGKQSGELSWFPTPEKDEIATCELDLLYVIDKNALGILDLKTGRSGENGFADTLGLFQAQFNAAAVFANYPDVERVRWQSWHTRVNPYQPSDGAWFQRDRMADFAGRFFQIIDARHKALNGEAPAWPSIEKCAQCPAVSACPDSAVGDVAADPAGFMRRTANLFRRAEAREAVLKAWVKKHGPIASRGLSYGVRPPSRATTGFYGA
jgi:hypothetical protein